MLKTCVVGDIFNYSTDRIKTVSAAITHEMLKLTVNQFLIKAFILSEGGLIIESIQPIRDHQIAIQLVLRWKWNFVNRNLQTLLREHN